jgi:hypothetical protein
MSDAFSDKLEAFLGNGIFYLTYPRKETVDFLLPLLHKQAVISSNLLILSCYTFPVEKVVDGHNVITPVCDLNPAVQDVQITGLLP